MGKVESLPKWAQQELEYLKRRVKEAEDQLHRPNFREGDERFVQTGYAGSLQPSGYKLEPSDTVHMGGFEIDMNEDGILNIRDRLSHKGRICVMPVVANVLEIYRAPRD